MQEGPDPLGCQRWRARICTPFHCARACWVVSILQPFQRPDSGALSAGLPGRATPLRKRDGVDLNDHSRPLQS
jgi:hypothetical protein